MGESGEAARAPVRWSGEEEDGDARRGGGDDGRRRRGDGWMTTRGRGAASRRRGVPGVDDRAAPWRWHRRGAPWGVVDATGRWGRGAVPQSNRAEEGKERGERGSRPDPDWIEVGEFFPRSRLDREGRGSGVVGGSGSGCPRVSADGEDMGSGVGRPRWWPGGPRPFGPRPSGRGGSVSFLLVFGFFLFSFLLFIFFSFNFQFILVSIKYQSGT